MLRFLRGNPELSCEISLKNDGLLLKSSGREGAGDPVGLLRDKKGGNFFCFLIF
jgi:hypothetical protein